MAEKLPAVAQIIIHRDGRVTYWSVYRQQWVRQRREAIPAQEVAAMAVSERTRLERAAR